MIPVKCPRCTMVWYSNEEDAGRVRLCDRCTDFLRRNRRGGPVKLDAFLIATAGFVLVDIVFIPLAALLPGTVGPALFVYGLVLSIGALIVSQALAVAFGGVRALWWIFLPTIWEQIDWNLMRWPVMIGPAGLACILAYFSLGIPAWQEHAREQEAERFVPRQPPTGTFGSGFAPGRPGGGATAPGQVPPATDLPGLLGYWSFDDDSLPPTVPDQSGKRHHAMSRGATWREGVRGQALSFDGRVWVDYGNSPDFNFAAGAPSRWPAGSGRGRRRGRSAGSGAAPKTGRPLS
jgi:hypothetical protein